MASSDEFFLGQSAAELFGTALEITKELSKGGKIRYRISPGGGLSLKVDDAALKQALSKKKFDQDIFTKIFNAELSIMLDAILNGEEETLVSNRCDPDTNRELRDRSSDEIAEYKGLFQQKLAAVKVLITSELRGKYLVKRTSKNEKLKDLSWEVSEKIFDREFGKTVAYPHATLAFETIRLDPGMAKAVPFMNLFFPNFRDWAGRVETTVFDVDFDDLNDLIDSLNAAKDALSERLGRKNK